MKEGELYKVKTDPDSGYDLESIELRVTAYAISGVEPEGTESNYYHYYYSF